MARRHAAGRADPAYVKAAAGRGDANPAREIPVVDELILRIGDPADRQEGKLAQPGIDGGPVAELAVSNPSPDGR